MTERRERGKGIDRKFVDSQDYIIEETWADAAAHRQPVGECRQGGCGGLLMGRPSRRDEYSSLVWYEAECDSCGKEIVAPAGRVMRRSTRHDEMPKGWFAGRNDALRREGAGN